MGKVDTTSTTLPAGLQNKIGNIISVDKGSIVKYLLNNKIDNNQIGGDISDSLSFITLKGKRKYATYFVIHDVSFPAYYKSFPLNIDSNSWRFNDLTKNWKRKVTQLYVNRLGGSKSVIDLSKACTATKFERIIVGRTISGLFIHVELVQPRVYPPGDSITAPIAPNPGFTLEQYKRLALIYIVASFRKGEWLIPAFHACIDEGIKDGHDDPQKFDLKLFSDAIDEIVEKINS